MVKTITIAFLIFPLAVPANAQPQNLGAALAKLREPRTASTAELVDSVRFVGRASEPGNAEALKLLMSCIRDCNLPAPVRTDALRAAVGILDAGHASELLSALRGITEEIERTRKDALANETSSYYAAASVVSAFMELLPLKVRPSPDLFLSLLRDWAVLDFTEWRWGWLGPKAFDAIANQDVDVAVRRTYLLEVMNAVPAFQPSGAAVKLLSDVIAQSALRVMFLDSLKEGSRIHYGAASILARTGDEVIMPALTKLIEEGDRKSTADVDMIQYYIWQIGVQHPATKLLDFIRSTEHPNSEARVWALTRAAELGLSREQIRDALLAHCERYTSPADKTWMTMRPKLLAAAMRTGVLSSTDDRLLPPADRGMTIP